MSPSQRSQNTSKTAASAARSARTGAAAPKARGKASAGSSTAAARSSAAHRRATAPAPAPRIPEPPSQHAAYGGGLLDDDARHDIAGVVVAVVGVALLIAVLTPTSGVLTQAVSGGLHAVFGMGAFLIPVGLLVWALTFFVRVDRLVPGRVAIGLCLVALAAMGIVGLCTPGCEADPGRLFNEYVLADRGGYVGNGLAWLLLTLTGRVVGIVVLVGLAIAGLIVVGINAGQVLRPLVDRWRAQRGVARARAEERSLRARRAAAWGAQPPTDAPVAQDEGTLPRNYAPTALFDPSRPLSQQPAPPTALFAESHQTAVPTTLIPEAGLDADAAFDARVPVVRMPSHPAAPNPYEAAHERYFQEPSEGGGAPSRRAGATSLLPHLDGIAPDATPEARQAADAAPQPSERAPESAPAPRARSVRRAASASRRASSSWWNPADDWNRDDFDPDGYDGPSDNAYVPGVLPGAPLTIDEEEPAAPSGSAMDAAPASVPAASPASPAATMPARASRAAVPVAGEGSGPAEAARTPVPSRTADADDDVADRVASRTRAALAKQQGAPAGKKAPSHLVDATDSVELPWEPARVDAPEDGAAVHAAAHDGAPFSLPDPAIMQRNERGLERTPEQRREAQEMGVRLQTTLNEFGVKAQVAGLIEGPTCTTYEVSPGEGVRVSKFTSLEDDIARALAKASVRIYAPVPGTSYVGIEVPNATRQTVFFGDVLSHVDGGPLDFAVGLDANGKPVHVDLAKLPHLLVAGTTGSGKSVCVNSIVMSFLMRDTPEEVRLIMVDPKQVEFKVYDGIPHLIMPVITDMRQAAAALQWGVTEMDRRYRIFSNMGVRDLKTYNGLVENGAFEDTEFPLQKLPSIVIVIDELADLMMVAKKDVEASIVRIAQLGRAAGIHLIMATQMPRADIVTGLIRSNVACRICLKVAKGTDSQIVIDQTGAEKLLGNGDMLFLQTAWGDKPRRIQGCWLSDDEIAQVVDHLKEQGATQYTCDMAPLPGTQLSMDLAGGTPDGGASAANDDEPLAWKAATLVVENQLGSTSLVQRRLKLGYARAGRLMDMLEEMGVVGPARGSKPRDVLIRDLDELATLRGDFDGSEGDY